MTSRDKIEQLKADLTRSLEQNSPKYRRAIIRELDYLFRKYGTENFDDFIEAIQRYFDIPASAKATIVNELKQTQQQIG
ncbi:MAG: hypothetical protein AB1600_11415, partial [Bacteroidota bacterium]